MNKVDANLAQFLINEMKITFGADNKRINHAMAVLKFARQLQQIEGGDRTVIEAAAILHDIGIHAAEHKHGSAAGIYQEIEGPPIARAILERYNIRADLIEHICEIIGQHHSAKTIDTLEFRVIWDSDWLVNIPDELGSIEKQTLSTIIEKTFKTETGLKMAKELYCNNYVKNI